jgi:4'-phosphopantetheinyl transferase
MKEDQVHVWYASLDITGQERRLLSRFLSQDESQRAKRFRFQKDREHFIGSHGILREIIGLYLRKDPACLVFQMNAYGKPYLDVPDETTGMFFNLSHSRNAALYAFSQKHEVGIDIEYMRSDVVKDRTAEHTFSQAEVKKLRSLHPKDQIRAFYNCWTRKESYIKAKGEGLSIPLDQFEVSLTPGEPPCLLYTDWDEDEPQRWSLVDLGVGSSYTASLAVEGHGWELKCWRREGKIR